MTAAAAPLAAQPEPEPAGAPGAWSWMQVEGHPGHRFRLFLPGSLPERPAPLVVMLHGCTQSPDDLARGSRFNRVAAAHGVVVAWPEQTAERHLQRCWNWYDPRQQGPEGEAGMIVAVARQVMAAWPIDPARVYVGGISAGGAMALNAAVAGDGLFAAVGVHSGVPYRAAATVPEALTVMRGDSLGVQRLVGFAASTALEGPLPAVFAVHGEADAVVHPRNVAALFAQWSAAHGAGTPRDEAFQEGGLRAIRTRHLREDGSFPVEVWRVEGLGHAWSGGSPEGTFTVPRGIDASARMLEFFLAHPRP